MTEMWWRKKKAETKEIFTILGFIVSIPCLRLMIKISMPILIWLEDIYYYSYHLYEYDEVVQIFLIDFFIINSEKINPTLGHILDKEYISGRLTFNTTIYKGYYPVRDLPRKVYFDIYFLDYAKSIYIETFIHTIIW